MNLRRRLEALEKELTGSEPIVLLMADGRTETLRGNVLELLSRARKGDRTPEVELIAQSISSTEPDGAHMIDLARALLNGPEDFGPGGGPNVAEQSCSVPADLSGTGGMDISFIPMFEAEDERGSA